MDQQLSKRYVKHISDSVDDSLKYIRDRREGLIKSLRTRWEKFNNIGTGGIEPNVIYTIAGISGSGKSAFANMLESDIIDLNPNEDVVVLSFSFEMLSSKQVDRKISKKLRRTTKSLYSVGNPLTDFDYECIKNSADTFRKYPIYYVDAALTVGQISEIIREFQQTIAKDKWLVVMLDHMLLLKGSGEESERIVISDMEKEFIDLKKIGKTTIIQISQMNREIEKSERINNRQSHYPMRSDISTSDTVYQASDYVIVIHRPETLNITEYGPERIPTKDAVFLHIIKNREGELKILKFKNELQFNTLLDE